MEKIIPEPVPLGGVTQYVSSAAEAQANVAGNRLFSLVAFNGTGSDAYLFLNDSAAAIAGAAEPGLPPIKIAAGDTKGWGPEVSIPLKFSSGIAFGLSTSATSFTAIAASARFMAQYATKNQG